MKKTLALPLFLLLLLSLACNLAGQVQSSPTPDVAAIVNATLTAVAAQATPISPPAEPTATATTAPAQDFFPETGYISGSLSYPSEFIPPLRIVAFNMQDFSTAYMDIPTNQFDYTFELPVGEYTVVAYVLNEDGSQGLAGGYTAAVPCGLNVDCTDHGLLIVTVKAGETTTGIDTADWYVPEGTFPPMP